MKRLRELWGRVAGAGGPLRAAVISALCVATFAVCAGEFRYHTKRSGLIPGVATGQWGVSPGGVSALNSDPSVIILQVDPDRPFPYIVNQISRPQGLDRVRVRAEAAAQGKPPASCSGAMTGTAGGCATCRTSWAPSGARPTGTT
jgi:hypothetical protein